jgi:outer membrane receptor protein involved in Fe transport
MANRTIARAVRTALVSAGAMSAAMQAAPSAAQTEQLSEITVTGSRIVRRDFVSNSPITTFPAEQVVRNADVTIDTFLNTLPKVAPAGTTTSNNPGNGGQSNVDLGLGANRNLVLLDGRRAMPSASDLSIDINTIPQAMIESIEIVTGGASAVYGADAVTGAVNFKLKNDFEGVDIRASWSNSTEEWDAQEYVISGVMGGNFADGRGNAIVGFDYAEREGMIKSQRPFAANATSTTSYLPEANYIPSTNGPTQAAVDALFAGYDPAYVAGDARTTTLGFNLDGTLYSRGVFNSPLDVVNFRYPVDCLVVNCNFYPDFHSYNFDSVNIMVLPLERRSFMGKFNYEFEGGVEVFSRLGWTEYDSTQALAPTPFPTVTTRAPGFANSIQATSIYVEPGASIANNLVVPVTNPWIPADFMTLLNSRTGNNASLVGSGATEPFLMRQRTVDAGLRTSDYSNTVVQYMFGAKGPIGEKWGWEVSYSEGFTEIDQKQGGNLDTNRVYELINAADGGVSRCGPDGFNIFGRNPLSPECVAYLTVASTLTRDFKQQIGEVIFTGDLAELPAGPLSVALGAQGRWFKYELDPGPSGGPISGFNAQTPSKGENSFEDLFFEALIPIVKDRPGVQSLELNLGYRNSTAEFKDQINDVKSPSDSSDAYFVSANWEVNDNWRFRGGYQRAVRAPNFGELFDGGGSAPQYFDPCSVTTNARTGSDAAAIRQLCLDNGVSAANIDIYVQTPGNQITITTAGNTNLGPEKADTYSVGVVFSSPWGGRLENLQASLDYSKIKLKDTIITPAPNVFVAACYNYYGTNPTFDVSDPNCQAIIRFGGDIIGLSNPVSGDGTYPGINGGEITGEALDLQVNWGMPLGKGDIRSTLLWTHNLSAKTQEAPGFPHLDYQGSVTFFGAGLGSSVPDNKIMLSNVYTIGDWAFDARTRYIASMKNRAAVIFPGETFDGVNSVTYFDLGISWRTEFLGGETQLRLGVNNVFDKQPPEYSPNVQSGTESSLYDLVGRRMFAQAIVKF